MSAKTIDTFRVTLTGDASQLSRTMKKVSKSFEGLGRKMRGIGVGMSAALTAPLGWVGKNFLDAASDAEEMTSKFNAVFRENAVQVQAWAESYGNAIGRSTEQLMEMGASVQDTFVPMGFARDEAAEMSKQLTTLAVDVASFNNKLDEDVMRDFQSALVGNTETVRKYGIVITQVQLGQELVNMGIAKGVKGASEAEKVQARLNLIMRGTTDAQGDAIRTADSYANQVKSLKGEFSELAVELGQIIMPIAAKFVGWLKEGVLWFKGLDDGTKLMILTFGALAAAIGPIVLGLSGVATVLGLILSPMGLVVAGVAVMGLAFVLFRDEIMNALRPVGQIFEKFVVDPVTKVFKWLFKAIIGHFKTLAGAVGKIAGFLGLDEVQSTFEAITTGLEGMSEKGLKVGVVEPIVGAAGSILDGIKGKFSEVLKYFSNGLSGAYDGFVGSPAPGAGSGGSSNTDDPTGGKKVASEVESAFTSSFASVGDVMKGFFKSGKEGFDSLKNWAANTADSILDAFANVALNSIFNAIAPGLGGKLGFGQGLAGGGRISAPTLVGERGPELFIPSGVGSIRNAADTRGMFGGGAAAVTINMTNRFDVGVETLDQRIAVAAPKIARAAQQGTLEAISRGGMARQVVRS
jgi:hypothetical protein